eukprot:6197418-Pleurochrysis_carterae.AAC.1
MSPPYQCPMVSPCTSLECNWKKPSAGKWLYDETLPIERHPTRKQDRNVSLRPYSDRGASVTHGEGCQADWQVRSTAVQNTVDMNQEEVIGALAELLDAVNERLQNEDGQSSESDDDA